jgi:hypothetical protein
MGQLLPGQIRQVSEPVFNPITGYWYDEVRVLQPDGSGGFIIVSDEVNVSPVQFSQYPLPMPWTDNIIPWEQFMTLKLVGDLLADPTGEAGAKDEVQFWMTWDAINNALRDGGDPFSGTLWDVPYYSWPGSDAPWPPYVPQLPNSQATPGTIAGFPNPVPPGQRPATAQFPPPGVPYGAPFALKHPSPADPRDPLVLDLAGAGIKLSSVTQSSAYFDFTGSGFAAKTGWITQGEGFLVLNGNPNAPITVSELVGAQSGDGFADLAALDTDGDGVINASDPAFANLSVWVDVNGNGQLGSGELARQRRQSMRLFPSPILIENCAAQGNCDEIMESIEDCAISIYFRATAGTMSGRGFLHRRSSPSQASAEIIERPNAALCAKKRMCLPDRGRSAVAVGGPCRFPRSARRHRPLLPPDPRTFGRHVAADIRHEWADLCHSVELHQGPLQQQ